MILSADEELDNALIRFMKEECRDAIIVFDIDGFGNVHLRRIFDTKEGEAAVECVIERFKRALN